MFSEISPTCRVHTEHITIVQLEYLNATVLRRGVGEIRVVVGRDPAC
jgi:hypothetical protein